MKKLILIIGAGIVLAISSCTPKETIEDKIKACAIHELKTDLKSPSSLIVDSINVVSSNTNKPKIQIAEYSVEIYYQAQNAFGAMLKDDAHYIVIRNTSTGKLEAFGVYEYFETDYFKNKYK